MAHAGTLPNEILLDIFERLQDAPSELVSAMKCCRRWNRLATSILYSHVQLDSKLREDSAGARFARHAALCDQIQSFNLHISQVHLMGFNILSADAFDRLADLSDVLRRMEHLKTFALSFEESLGRGFPAPGFAIVTILNNLPKTVVNLNLDCCCISSPSLTQPHVCHAVGALLPQLRSLRLRTSYLCSGLLACLHPQAAFEHERAASSNATTSLSATSPLEYLVIRLIACPESEHGPHTALCYSEDALLSGTAIANTLQNLHQAGGFPSLRQLAVIGRVDAPESPRKDNWDVFKVRTISKDATKTITFPWCPRGGSSSLYMIRDMEEDWFGPFSDIADALEGPLAWKSAGIRPSSTHRKHNNSHWELDHTRLASRDSVMEKFGVSFRLWKHEGATGMKLLQVRTATGFDDTAAMRQSVPSGWRWVPEGPWDWTIEPVAMA